MEGLKFVSMEVHRSEIRQVLVKLIDGKHKILNLADPLISVAALKHRIQTLTSIPSDLHLLLSEDSRIFHNDLILDVRRPRENFRSKETLDPTCSDRAPRNENSINIRDSGTFPVVVHLLLRLRGGKGGFGSLLRGAATKAGQKKTNNFDACRDMSGRRLRHVNAEKKLEEWRAEAEERKLEKIAEEYIKKKTNEAMKRGKGSGANSTDKYVAKYREDSARCMEEVERSVRESVNGLVSLKRMEGTEGGTSASSKRLKIWYGKRKLVERDSEGDSDKEEDENSVIVDTGNHCFTKEGDQSSGSVNDGKPDKDSSLRGSEEEKEETTLCEDSLKQDNNSNACLHNDGGSDNKLPDEFCQDSINGMPMPLDGCGSDEVFLCPVQVSNSAVTDPVRVDAVSASVVVEDMDKPLNFDEYHSASELEVLGMERLKKELQEKGLKCGGTLQERAARLFLLKTTPIEMLPKKLLAKK